MIVEASEIFIIIQDVDPNQIYHINISIERPFVLLTFI